MDETDEMDEMDEMDNKGWIYFSIIKICFIDHTTTIGIGVCEKYLQKTKDKMAINLIKMLRLGPLVSFKGSPTVSPITAAL